MASLIPFIRLIICIEITAFMMTLFLYRREQGETCLDTALPNINMMSKPGYKTGQPLFSWKIPKTEDKRRTPVHLLEYNDVCHRLGYNIRFANDTFFKCNQSMNSRPDLWCDIYRSHVPYRISNFEGADVKITDYVPGLYEHVGNKAKLVSRGGKYIPKGFYMPGQVKDFVKYSLLPENKDKRWIQKHYLHRGNKVKELHELDLSRESIIQEFITNPFLIDGRKFSIGVFVALTSANPLRAYALYEQMTLRFCPKVYNPNNFTEMGSYVSDGMEYGCEFVGQIHSLRNSSTKQQYSSKQSVDAYVYSVGGDSSTIYLQIWDAIRGVLTTRNDLLGQDVDSGYRSRHFQWTRWDFILDSNLKIHLIEANINPAMSCTKVTPDQMDVEFCHNVVYNLFRALGIASFYDFHKTSIQYVVRDTDIHIGKDLCYLPACNLCKSKECQLCSQCLSGTERDILKSVLWEHLRRGQTRLVYPSIRDQPTDLGHDSRTHTSSEDRTDDNEITKEWLRLKCLKDIQWCNIIK